jgi:transposase
VIAWHLLPDPGARFYDLGPGYHAARTDPERRKRSHIPELGALGYTVTLTPAA